MPVWRELTRRGHAARIIHLGQHVNSTLDVYSELQLPKPDVQVDISGGTHGSQTVKALAAVEADLIAHRPDWLVVVGDVNGTLGAALAAPKLNVKLAHVEAGLRSHNWRMPEEINRVLVDELADLWLTPDVNTHRRACSMDQSHARHIEFVGNVMIDSLAWALRQVPTFTVPPHPYAVVTMHRPSNVDTSDAWAKVIQAVDAIEAAGLRIIWPAHPRAARDRRMIDPLSYVSMVHLMRGAKLVLTDSGGVQEETTYLNVPCLTFRNETERPITVLEGTNVVVGTGATAVAECVNKIMKDNWKPAKQIHLWDGRAARRIVDELERHKQ